jgi:hypothetical protein
MKGGCLRAVAVEGELRDDEDLPADIHRRLSCLIVFKDTPLPFSRQKTRIAFVIRLLTQKDARPAPI